MTEICRSSSTVSIRHTYIGKRCAMTITFPWLLTSGIFVKFNENLLCCVVGVQSKQQLLSANQMNVSKSFSKWMKWIWWMGYWSEIIQLWRYYFSSTISQKHPSIIGECNQSADKVSFTFFFGYMQICAKNVGLVTATNWICDYDTLISSYNICGPCDVTHIYYRICPYCHRIICIFLVIKFTKNVARLSGHKWFCCMVYEGKWEIDTICVH